MGRHGRSRGTIGQRKGRAGWWVRYFDARRKRHCVLGGATLAEAEAELARRLEREDDVAFGRLRAVSLAEFLAEDAYPVLRPRLGRASFKALAGRAAAGARHFGLTAMADIDRAAAEGFLASLRIAPATVAAYRSALSVVWRLAVDRRCARENPWLGIPVARAQQRAVRFLTEDDLVRLYAACPARIRAFVTVLGETGLRRGEALALQWGLVERDLSRLTVARSKTGRVREVPLTETARAALSGLRRRKDRTRVFRRVGASWPKRCRAMWRRAKRRAGLPRDYRLHDLRHARASLLVRAGVPIPTVARWLGHSSAQLVLTRYGTHAPADELARALSALETARRTPPPPPP
jgi:integrase